MLNSGTYMRSTLLRLRITHKIAAISLSGIIGLGTVGGIYLTGSAAQDEEQARATEARVIAATSAVLDNHLLHSRRAEKDFLLRDDDKYVDRHAELAVAIGSDLDALQRQVRHAVLPDLEQKLAGIRSGYAKYLSDFAKVVEAKRKLGLNENSGLQGTLRKSVHEIETKLKEFDEPRLAVTMLMMRRHEKDFMLRRDPKYGDDLKKRAAEFTAELGKSRIPAPSQDEISRKLASYQHDFVGWMETALVIAREQKAMSDGFAAIEPVIAAVQQAAETLRADAETAEAASRSSTRLRMQLAIVLVIVVVSGLGLLIGRSISGPLTAMARSMGLLAQGKFDVVLPGLSRADEVGDMAQAIEGFKVKAIEKAQREAEQKEGEARAAAEARKAEMHRLADVFQSTVGGIVEGVSSTSTELEAAASTLTRTADMTQQLSGSVATASQQASSNVQSVASATEEMTSSVGEISRRVEESSRIASDAVRQVEATDSRIGILSEAAGRIGDVVNLITAIAEQTNLLALNATIEAARAGEAGRGFAVVAQEVKALASQTAKATGEIGTQINTMQAATRESVIAIKEISSTIRRVSDVAAAISAAVEEQAATNREISRNVQQAAQGTAEVASSIADVSHGAADTGSASTQVLASARSLANESNHLKIEVEKFLHTVRAA
jgi:methyl-accepting chemotaxis protein